MRKCGELLLKRALKVVSGVTSRPCSVVVLVHLALECFWHLQSGLFRTLGPARGAHPLEAHLNPLAAHRRAPEVVPIIPDPNLSPDLDLGQDLNPGKSGFWFKVHNKIIVWDFGFLTCDFCLQVSIPSKLTQTPLPFPLSFSPAPLQEPIS